MKTSQIFRSLAVVVILALMVLAVPATPAQAATVTVTPSSGPVGTTITVSGTGFTADNTYQITFAYGTTYSDIIGSGTVRTSGDVPATTFIVPEIPGGTYTIRIETFGTTGESRTGTFTLTAEIELDETSGLVGDEVILDGTGFAANSTVTIYFTNENVGTAETDANGSFSDASFTVPESSRGSHTVKAQDSSGNSDTATFTTKQSVSVTPTTGASGDEAKVSGTGFRSRKDITITFNGLATSTTPPSVESDDYGSFTAIFVVPVIVKGTYKVEVSDGKYKASADFTVAAGASIDKTKGAIGEETTVSGTGFTVGATVSVTYDGEEVASDVVDSNGTFSVSFEIPVSKHGTHRIIASDGTNTKEFTFTVESDPPPVPPPLLPEMGVKAEPQTHFDWDDVEDPSGVTYTLQIATDEDFPEDSIILEKKGLAESEYTLTEEEKLESVKKEEPYYWRVRAVDGASNQGDWSTPGWFYVGFQWPELKGWLLYVLIGIGAVVFLLLGFWLGRRTAYY